jgi:hypothetical protein
MNRVKNWGIEVRMKKNEHCDSIKPNFDLLTIATILIYFLHQ